MITRGVTGMSIQGSADITIRHTQITECSPQGISIGTIPPGS